MFVVSPEGPYLIKLIEGVNRLTPYSMIKQTLRVSNAATMISGMMKLFLAKLSYVAIKLGGSHSESGRRNEPLTKVSST